MATRRSAGKIQVARSLWYAKRGVVELRSQPLQPPAPDMVTIRTHYSGVSRGTERLVLNGLVPESERDRMRAPFQDGAFPFPVKYGYCAAGIVEDGPKELAGRAVFCLHPHQDVFQVPFKMAVPVPEGVPLRRATLAANMETALNAVWDSGAGPADRIVVVGAGIVGLLVAFIAARLPGAEVTVIDPQDARRELVEALGGVLVASGDSPAGSRPPDAVALRAGSLPDAGSRPPGSGVLLAPGDSPEGSRPPGALRGADVVFHTSASEAGLATAIGCAGFEGTVVEMSWFGEKPVAVPLGGAFHSQRLKLVSSQVGQVSASRRARWDYRRRMLAALALLADPVLDRLLETEIAFDEAPAKLPALLAPDAPGLAPVIRYAGAG